MAAILPPELIGWPGWLWITAAGGLLASGAAVGGVWRARGSTAVPAAWWGVAAGLALAAECGARGAGLLQSPAAVACVRLVVVGLGMCPAMSLLGAKRPQHQVWQLIVATLAVVLSMPAVSAGLVRPGSVPDVHLLQRCFLMVLVVVGWMNFVGTGRRFAATAIAVGQWLLAGPFLPGVDTDLAYHEGFAIRSAVVDPLGAWLVAAGALAAVGMSRAGAVSEDRLSVDRPFRALRETLGAAWTLRIIERFDSVATARKWPCRLRFAGLETTGDLPDNFWQRDARRTLKALLRRFVTEAWLDRHGWPADPARQPGRPGRRGDRTAPLDSRSGGV